MTMNGKHTEPPPPPVNLTLYRMRERLRLLAEKARKVAEINGVSKGKTP